MALSWYQPHSSDVPQDFLEERGEKGLFRCMRCTGLWPLPIIWQDGFRLCRRCWDPISALEARVMMASEIAANASAPFAMLEFNVTGDSDGVGVVTVISPLSLNLTRGGAAGTITITGVNLTSADTWAASDAVNITITPTIVSAKSVTLSISAGGATPRADYNIKYNGDTLTPRGILKVR